MKRIFTMAVLLLVLLTCAVPLTGLAAKGKAMNDGVPVWSESTVKQYALDFIHGNDMRRLYGFYDLQVRRYMPLDTYSAMLTELEWMTGAFDGFGTYTAFEETELKTKTHVLHICMQKQDLDLYFTHKNLADDWEVMAVEFVPAAKQEVVDAESDAEATASEEAAQRANYTEIAVQVGTEPYLLDGVVTLPAGASTANPVPGVVLVQGSGPLDKDSAIGQTKLFADIADLFAKKGIATLRYDKRTYTYGETMTAEEIQALTVQEETIQDAIAAGKVLGSTEGVDAARLVLLGHSMGAMLAPRIADGADGAYKAMILIAGSPKSLLDISLAQNYDLLDTLSGDARTAAEAQVAAYAAEIVALKKVKKADDARSLTVGGLNGYYFWEMMQFDLPKLIKKLRLPTYIVQGNADFQVSLENGIEAYEDGIESKYSFVDYHIFRKLNHLLMTYSGPGLNKGTLAEYDTPATLDTVAGRNLADWILALGLVDDEE